MARSMIFGVIFYMFTPSATKNKQKMKQGTASAAQVIAKSSKAPAFMLSPLPFSIGPRRIQLESRRIFRRSA
jgi:hypothetical protein